MRLRNSTSASSRRGLSLLEVALAVAILAIMGTLTWGTIGRSFDAYETVTDIDARYHNVRSAMHRMATEISMAFLAPPQRVPDEDDQWKTIFKGRSTSPFYELTFTSFAHQVLRQDAKESDQAEITYFGERDPDDRSKTNLMRRVDPRIDGEPERGGRSAVMAEGIKDFKLRFWDERKEDWIDEWDTEDTELQGRLPPIVEIIVVVEDENGKDLTLRTKTRIFVPRLLQL